MKNKNQIFNIAIVVLLLAFLVLMFLPYFTYEEVNYSINGSVWLYTRELKPFFSVIEGFRENNNTQYLALVLAFVIGVGTLLMHFMKSNSLGTQVLSVIWCLVVSIGFPINEMLKMGNMTIFYIMMAVTVVIDVLVVLRLIVWIKEWKVRPKKHHYA